MAGTPHHQGVVARAAGARYAALDDVLRVSVERGEPPFIVALDNVQDPRNLGALLRSAEVVGVHGVILPKHHAVGLTPAVAKAAAGALEWIPVARVSNLVQSLEALKAERLWVVGSAVQGGEVPWATDLSVPLCLVFGGEGQGLRPIVARTCDVLVTLPMRGRVESMSVSAAAAALCYEVLRQRMASRRPEPGLERHQRKGLDYR
jgi:23S rRNA (guanosine2251-2'-O)-methyltransferase